MWYWVSLPYATYGIEVTGGKVTDAAPIANWMIGRNAEEMFRWVTNKGGKYHPLPEV